MATYRDKRKAIAKPTYSNAKGINVVRKASFDGQFYYTVEHHKAVQEKWTEENGRNQMTNIIIGRNYAPRKSPKHNSMGPEA